MALADFVAEKAPKGKSDVFRRYIGPVAVLVAVLALWSFVVSPWINEFRADLAFLRAARIQAIQQIQQRAQQAQPEAK